jgi:phosphatidylglycerophosphate synthase
MLSTPTQPSGTPASVTKPSADMFARLAVNPVAVPFARWLAGVRGVTPNRITVLAGVAATASAACFAAGAVRVGGALFVLRFYIDCLDGIVARVQRRSSARGAALDLMVDVGGIALCTASLGWYLTRHDHVPAAVVLYLLAAIVAYNFLLAYRKQIAAPLGQGDGGGRDAWQPSIPLVRNWVAFARRIDMTPIPYAVEAEILSFGLVPLIGGAAAAGDVLWATLAFYVVASLVNARRIWRIAAAVDDGRGAGDRR